MPYTVAIVEDDDDQRGHYREAMLAKGFDVLDFNSRSQAMSALKKAQPDLVILDIVLGHEVDGGFDLCRELLAIYHQLPVIFLTDRIEEIDRISGLRMGAWDYLPKPVSLAFLGERVASLLRLVALRQKDQNPEVADVVGSLRLNEETMLALWQDSPLELTLTEFRILARLAKSSGQAVSYESLMSATKQQYVTNNTINTHMRNMRKKFKQLDGEFRAIKNEYGFGYRWVEG